LIDKNFTFLNCKVKINPGVKIIIDQGIDFTIDGSHLFTCSSMWEGIIMSYFSRLTTKSSSIIEDANGAIQATNISKVFLNITETTFNKNRKCIMIQYSSPTSLNTTFITAFKSNVFMCNGFLKGTSNEITHSGVYLKNAGFSPGTKSIIGANYNTFNGIIYGIYQEGGTKVINIANYTFKDIRTSGIYSQNANITGYELNFTNCNKGIYINFLNYLDIRWSKFHYDVNSLFPGIGIQLKVINQNSLTNIASNEFTLMENYVLSSSASPAYGIKFGEGIPTESFIENNATIYINYNTFNAFPYNQDSNDDPVSPPARFLYAINIYSHLLPNTSFMSIENNNFYQNHYSNAISSYGERSNFNVSDNLVRSSRYDANISLSNGYFFGASSGTENYFISNKLIDRYNPLTQLENVSKERSGLTVKNFKNFKIWDNEMWGCQYSYQFRDNCLNTNFIQNQSVGGQLLYMSARGIISDQKLKGNQWHPYPPNTGPNWAPQAQIASTPEYSLLSKFEVTEQHSSNNYTDPKPYNPHDINPLFHPGGVDYWWEYLPNSENIECSEALNYNSETNNLIISNGIDSIISDSLILYQIRYSLYDQFYKYPQISDSISQYSNWMDSISSVTNIDELVTIENSLNNILHSLSDSLSSAYLESISSINSALLIDSTLSSTTYDSLLCIIDSVSYYKDIRNNMHHENFVSNIIETIEALNEIQPDNNFERVIINYLNLFYSTFIDSNLTESQIDTLQNLSELCTDQFGKYPILANLLLAPCDRTVDLGEETSCYTEELILTKNKDLLHKSDLVSKVYDLYGRTVYSSHKSINISDFYYLPLPTGIYIIKHENSMVKIFKK